jgi:hypothetical protein
MLQAHSLLWHYLWVAPNLYLLLLSAVLYRRGLHREYPAFFAFSLVIPLAQLILYAADVLPWVSANTFWHVLWSGLLIEAIVKFALIGELFVHIFSPYSSIAKLGKTLIRATGVTLALLAAVAAAIAPGPNSYFVVSGPHLLEQTIYIIESGLLVFIFLFSAYFRLKSDRTSLGIALGLAVSACVQLGTWAFAAHNIPKETSVMLDFLNMAAYHIDVLVWWYYIALPHRADIPLRGPVPENNLEIWNRELERLIHS